jgi:hypothetical protein
MLDSTLYHTAKWRDRHSLPEMVTQPKSVPGVVAVRGADDLVVCAPVTELQNNF